MEKAISLKEEVKFGNIKKRSLWAGVFILTAYFVLASAVTQNKAIVLVFEVLSGVSVIGIAYMLYPAFSKGIKSLNIAYFSMKVLEGLLMIGGGFLFFMGSESALKLRDMFYDVHLVIFIVSAMALYVILYRLRLVPRWLSVWGIVASIFLSVGNVIALTSLTIPLAITGILFSQIMLNEVVMAIYLMVKGLHITKE